MSEGTIAAALGRDYHEFKDRFGVTHKAPPLTLGDMADVEDEIGGISEWSKAFTSARAAIALLWHSVRKEGLDKAALKSKQWAYTRDDVGDWFLVGNLGGLTDALTGILKVSGLDVGAKTPPRPITEATPTHGEASSAPASPAVAA